MLSTRPTEHGLVFDGLRLALQALLTSKCLQQPAVGQLRSPAAQADDAGPGTARSPLSAEGSSERPRMPSFRYECPR